MQQPEIVLNNNVRMPQIGFGVFQIPANECADVVGTALGAGYRLVDTAQTYFDVLPRLKAEDSLQQQSC